MLTHKGLDKWNSLRFGLVLSGGGAKGAYEAGAVRAMRELDISERIFGVAGTSVGALNTLMFAMNDGGEMWRLWEDVSFSTVVPVKQSEDKGVVRGLLSQLHDEGLEDAVFTQQSLRSLLTKHISFDAVRAHRAELYACCYDIEGRKCDYFDLKTLTDDEMTDAVLASAAIPHVYDPVTVRGVKYADGGINDPAYGVRNADVTPVAALQDKDYDILLVIHLREQDGRDLDHIGSMRLVHIYPSEALEAVKGTGTMNFRRAAIREKLNLGYRDAALVLSTLLMEYLKG